MERIKRFFLDEAASAEMTSSVLLIGAVVIIGAAALVLFWNAINGFFGAVAGWVDKGTTAANSANFPG